MNNITHVTVTIDFDVWQPFQKDVQRELDALLGMLRAKDLLAHAGDVRTHINVNQK